MPHGAPGLVVLSGAGKAPPFEDRPARAQWLRDYIGSVEEGTAYLYLLGVLAVEALDLGGECTDRECLVCPAAHRAVAWLRDQLLTMGAETSFDVVVARANGERAK